MQNDLVLTRNNLIRYLRHLTANVWPEYPGESVLPEEADRLLREAQIAALRFIGIQLQADPVAREFVETIDRSIPGPPYDHEDTLLAARRLAPRFLRRLEKERDEEQDQAKRDPMGVARREYVRRNAETNPWLQDSNVCLDGLAMPDKPRYKLDPSGHVVEED